MEKKNSSIYWGAILVVFGLIFLAKNLNWLEFELTLRQIARFWPLLLILAGVAVFINPRRSMYNAGSALLIAFAIPLSIYNCTDEGVKELKNELKDGVHIDLDDDETSYKSQTQQSFVVEASNLPEAKLDIEGGAARFDLVSTTDKLFEANTSLHAGSYKISDAKDGNVHEIDFTMNKIKDENFNIDIDEKGKGNRVEVKLSAMPLWTIDLGFGAGKADFDLSEYKVKKLNIQSGAAAVDVKLGDKQTESRVKVDAGVSSVTIKVPKGVACEIIMDSALSAKDFDDFNKVSDGKWQTEGFDKATKKIYLDIDTGLSSVQVERY